MKGGRYSKTSFAASVVSLLLIAGQISTSVEQQTQHNIDRNSDLSRESSTNLPSYDLSQLSRNVARCVSHSDDVARALTDIRSSVQRMATASSTSSGAVALPGGCNCSISNDSGCTGIKQQLVELHRDVSAIKSRSEQSSTATSHVSATNASAAGEWSLTSVSFCLDTSKHGMFCVQLQTNCSTNLWIKRYAFLFSLLYSKCFIHYKH